jgi:hypothetical protein
MPLSFDAIFSADDRETVTVAVPEWAGEVMLRPLSVGENEALNKSMLDKDGNWSGVNYLPKLLSLAMLDDKGQPLGLANFARLSVKSNKVITRLGARVQEISGIGAKAVDDAEKNSEPDPSGDSSSESPGKSDGRSAK